MNAAQTALYWREWSECRKALLDLGKLGNDDQRKSLQRSAIGERTKSSKDLTNAELTAVIAKFRTFSRPGDFNAQMHAVEEPGQRIETMRNKVAKLAVECGINGGFKGVSNYFKKWLGGVAVEQLDAEKLRKLVFILERRKAEKSAAPATGQKTASQSAASASATNSPEDDGDPF
jgi:hypothetical protein